jgi:hypothetical protein
MTNDLWSMPARELAEWMGDQHPDEGPFREMASRYSNQYSRIGYEAA